MTDRQRWLRATVEERMAWVYPERPERISSHAGWYRGRWVKDTCGCGRPILVPAGDSGKYRCNRCADRAEGYGD